MAGTPLSGIQGRVSCNGTIVNLDKWEVDPKAVDLPSTNFESGGYEEGIMGVISADITFSGFWDAAANPHGTPNLIAGQILTNLLLYVNRTGARCFTFPSWRCVTVKVSNDLPGKVSISVTGKSNGTFTYPA